LRDVPLIQVSVEGGSKCKHCRKKEGQLHSQSKRKKRRRKNPDQNIQTSFLQPKTPSEPP
jgi:hypothetical protein